MWLGLTETFEELTKIANVSLQQNYSEALLLNITLSGSAVTIK